MKRIRRSTTIGLAAALVCTSLAGGVQGQSRGQFVPSPGRNVASVQDADAVLVNPANMSTLPGGELRWTWVGMGNDQGWSGARGHALGYATSLPFGLGFGVRADFMRPPATFEKMDPGALLVEPYTWLTGALSLGSRAWSIGLQSSHLLSDEARLQGVESWGVGMSYRASDVLSAGAVFRNVNGARTTRERKILDRQVSLGLGVRPLSTDALQLGLQADYYEGLLANRSEFAWPVESGWVLRPTFGMSIPYVGRLRAEVALPVEEEKTNYVASAVLDVNARSMTASGGMLLHGGVDTDRQAQWLVGVSLHTWQEAGIVQNRYALRVRLETVPSNRKHIALLRKLWKAARDPEIAAVVLQLKSSPATSLAHAYEIDDAVQQLRSHDKKVICQLEDAGLRALVSCAHASKVLVHPAGGVRFAGLSIRRLYFGETLRRMGIRTQFVRIGRHKSAPEGLTAEGPTEVSQEDTKHNLQLVQNGVVDILSKGRGKSPQWWKQTFVNGPFTAKECVRDHLVDGYGYDDELENIVSQTVGTKVELRNSMPKKAPERWGLGARLAVVLLEGDIVDGRSSSVPLIGTKLAGSYTIADTLKRVRQDGSIGAVVVRIESPGGSTVASDVMWREVSLTAATKPVIVSMGGVAASGGYYAAAGATRIVATPFTVTGSIGVFYGKADVQTLLGKLGVGVHTTKTAPRADAESIFRPFDQNEVRLLGQKVKQFYDVFIDRVARGRHMSPSQVDAIARGRVWMGVEAKRLGLVDQVGGLRQAMELARDMAGLRPDCRVVVLPPPRFSIFELARSLAVAREDDTQQARAMFHDSGVVGQMRSLLRAALPFVIYGSDEPLALSEWMEAP